MNMVKGFWGAGRTGFFAKALFFAVCLLPLAASAACTQEMAETLVKQNLNLRLQFLKSEERMPVYEAATAERSARVQQMIAKKEWRGVCGEVFGMISIADDVLAGGNGRSDVLSKPWGKCTPEKMLSLAAEYDLICLPDRRIENCARRNLTPLRRELINLKARVGRDDDLKAAFYVNRTCELYTELLKIINE